LRKFKDVRFADDEGMIAGSERGLQKMTKTLNFTATKYGMKICKYQEKREE